MSQENVEVVRRVTDVMDAEGFEAALPIFLKLLTRRWNGWKIQAGLAPPPTGVSSRSGR